MDFNDIASRYERDSLIQRSAAEKLMGLLDIRRDDDVLDLGCGTGSLTRKLRSLAQGKVVGIDPSGGMIDEAVNNRAGLDIDFKIGTAEEGLAYDGAFSAVFCNSAFQWFADPLRALGYCHAALRSGGRMGIQAPAKKAYCPNFIAAIDAVAKDPRTASIFAGFKPPWLFLDTAEEYVRLFTQAGFIVPFAKIETISTLHSPDEVMTIFESGAAAGYLNAKYYAAPFGKTYANAFREVVKGSFESQTTARGAIDLVFNRIYLVAVKPHGENSRLT